MGKVKKTEKRVPPGNRINKAGHSFNPDRTKGAGGQNMRDKATINRLLMYKNFKAKRDKAGKILKPAPFQSYVSAGTMARVEPNRKWFGNTRVVSQSALQTFQEEMKKAKSNPYNMILRPTKLPITLLNETQKYKRVHILDTEPYEATFGPKAQRKRPKLNAADLEGLVKQAEMSAENYEKEKDLDLIVEDPGFIAEAPEMIFKAGQSKRVWSELYKVIDSADVIAQVLDARDPMGTRSKHMEDFLKKEKPHKQLVFIINKCDLVPPRITKKWIKILNKEYPTMAFRANIKNSFGKGSLIDFLRHLKQLHSDKKQISVGFAGYPNVGKSSIINTLKGKKVCNVAPIAGETKVWQYVTLTRKIYLIDCPGVAYPIGDTETDIVLKGVVRVENIKTPEDHIVAVLDRVKRQYIENTYNVSGWETHEEFLEKIALKSGRLLKGGQPDIGTVARMVLNDWQRGRIPYYIPPPNTSNDSTEAGKSEATDIVNNDSETANICNNDTVVAESEDSPTEPGEADDDDAGDDPTVKAESSVAEKKSAKETRKKSVNKKKRKHQQMDDDDVLAEKITGKKKRQRYLKEKVKKIGKHFYETANVKNRRGRNNTKNSEDD